MIKKIDTDLVIEEIRKKSLEEKIVIYGAGNYGITMCRYLKNKYNIEIEMFAVSSSQYSNLETCENKRIVTIDEIAEKNKHCILIISVSENKHQDFINRALQYKFDNIYIVLNEFMRYIQSELNLNKLVPLNKLNFEVHIVDHCNLNCRGCYHFSPLAKPDFLSIEEFERDFEQMKKLCGERVAYITLLGGEPLLHPQIIEFFKISRKFFGKCRIELLTNGTLLKKMDNKFWDACVENNISICFTKYPVDVDYKLLENMASSHGLKIDYHNDLGVGEKTLIKYPFDISGKQSIQWNYEHCTRSNKCITLKHGRIFTCPMAAHAHIAKEFFNLDIELSENDSIDIYKTNKYEDITGFLIKPIPFCRYCNLEIKPEQQEWGVSKRALNEWF